MFQNEKKETLCVNFKRIAHFMNDRNLHRQTQNACVAKIETKPIFALNFKWLNSSNAFCLCEIIIIMQDKQI